MNQLFRAAFLFAAMLAAFSLSAADEPTVKPDSKPDAPKPLVKIEVADPDQVEAAAQKALQAAAPKNSVSVSPEARMLLDAVRDAYAKLTSLEVTGTISANYLIGAEKQTKSDTFTGTFQSPMKFRHEMKEDMLVVCAGEKVYAYQASQNLFLQQDAPKERVAIKDLPDQVYQIISMQNPSLSLAIAKDASEQLLSDATSVKKLDDVTLEGKSFISIGITRAGVEYTYLIDPQTSLLRQVKIDQRAYLKKLGQSDVKEAQLTFDYTVTSVDGSVKDGLFAWVPPATARDMATIASARGSGEDENPATKLEGKASPDFKLMDLAGKEVSLTALKGRVVVVDFWATWCGPCIQSLPHLNQLYEDKKAAGLQVIAVSVDEDKAKVPTFVADKKLTFTVVIDTTEAKVAEKFAVNGIPQTVVIGKDGKVRKVFVGFGPGSAEKLRAEVDAAMK